MIKSLRENLTTWVFPLVGLYIYSLIGLIQYGYFSHFGLPSQIFIDTSFTANLVFLFDLLKSIVSVFTIISLTSKILSIISIIIIIFSFTRFKFFRYVIIFALIYIMFVAPKFGSALASNDKNFNYVDSSCVSNSDFTVETDKYIIVALNNNLIAFKTVNKDGKFNPYYIIRDINNISCQIKSIKI